MRPTEEITAEQLERGDVLLLGGHEFKVVFLERYLSGGTIGLEYFYEVTGFPSSATIGRLELPRDMRISIAKRQS